MGDRGFTIHESVWFHQAEFPIPAFTKGKDQLDPIDLEKTRGIANVSGIHAECVIGLLRQKYTVLQGTLPIDFLSSNGNKYPVIDKVVFQEYVQHLPICVHLSFLLTDG